MRLPVRFASAVVLLVLPAVVAGQDPPPSAHCAAPPSGLPADVKERPIGLDPGAGTLRQKVTAASEEAQAFYDQGVAYLASYVWIDDLRPSASRPPRTGTIPTTCTYSRPSISGWGTN